jgi:hypothetical protein
MGTGSVRRGGVADKEATKSEQARAQLARFPEVAALGHAVYTDEGLVLFLTTPLPVFGGRTAVELLDEGQAEPVLAALAADHEGLGF